MAQSQLANQKRKRGKVRSKPSRAIPGTSTSSKNQLSQIPTPGTLNDELAALFECSVCFDMILPPIMLCQVGHLVCASCRPKLTCCPTCRGTLAFGAPSNPIDGTKMFGTNATTYGAPVFGQHSASVFGAQQPQQQNELCSIGNTSTFGTQPQNAFGRSSIFGQQNSAPSNSLFWGTKSTFGAQNNQTGPFGQTSQAQSSGLFQEPAQGSIFGTSSYCANRKRPRAGGFGQTTKPFAYKFNPNIFGQADNKSVGHANSFGLSSTAFGNVGTGNVFGGSTMNTSNNSFGSFGSVQTQQSTPNIFGCTKQAKPFDQKKFFCAQPQQKTFGTSVIGQNNIPTKQTSIFDRPAQYTFPTPQTGYQFGNTAPTTQTTGLFQTPTPTTGFTGFNTSSPTTNSAWDTTGRFGTNAFANPAQQAFGQPTQPEFGTSQQMPQNNLFGSLGNKPAFGTTMQPSLFENTSLQPTCAFGLAQQAPAQPITLNASSQLNELRAMIANSHPFGYFPHLDNLEQFKPSGTHHATYMKDIYMYLKETDTNFASETLHHKQLKVRSPSVFDKSKMSNLKKPMYIVRDGRLVDKNAEGHSPLDTRPKAFEFNRSNVEQDTVCSPARPSPDDLSIVSKNATDVDDGLTESGELEAHTPTQATSSMDKSEEAIYPQNSDSSVDVADTCGLICTRPQYYILPALKDLAQYKNEDGTCIIKGFTIGRHGYGNVRFPDAIDVSNLNIDELVHFSHKQICVYLNDSTKPPVGEGLNKPAQVTLERVFPRKTQNTGETSQGVDNTRILDCVIQFEEVLRRACRRAGTSFEEYRPETGSWVFNVPHFSKYELLDSDEVEIRREATNQGCR